jgi:hypothetical protein
MLKYAFGWVWYHIPIIPALGMLRQKDSESKASVGYVLRSCLKKDKEKICIWINRHISMFLGSKTQYYKDTDSPHFNLNWIFEENWQK